MTFTDLNHIPTREPLPGFHGQFAHTDHVTFAYWNIEAGATLPEHAHPHEQITFVLEGVFELTLAGETRRVTAGGVAAIPGGVPHAGQAITACRIVDVFHPARDDYR